MFDAGEKKVTIH